MFAALQLHCTFATAAGERLHLRQTTKPICFKTSGGQQQDTAQVTALSLDAAFMSGNIIHMQKCMPTLQQTLNITLNFICSRARKLLTGY